MNKEEVIAKYGKEAWEKHLAQGRAYYKAHREELKARKKRYYEEHKEEVKARAKKYREEHKEAEDARNKKRREEHPEQVEAHNHEISRKDGKYYDKHLKYQRTGLRGDRNKIRRMHGNQYRPYKMIIAPDSQLHHEWIPNTADYRGVALVEADAHMYGIVDVIQILDGKITLLTEAEIRKGRKK